MGIGVSMCDPQGPLSNRSRASRSYTYVYIHMYTYICIYICIHTYVHTKSHILTPMHTHRDPSVMAAGLNGLFDLAKKDPRAYVNVVPSAVVILKQVIGHFPQKSHTISGPFSKRDL